VKKNTDVSFYLMKKSVIGILSGVALTTSGMVLGLSNPASASQLWKWSYSGGPSGLGGSGTFTTNLGPPNNPSPYPITAISGIAEGLRITGLAPPTPIGMFPINDNLLFVVGSGVGAINYLDAYGVGFYVDGTQVPPTDGCCEFVLRGASMNPDDDPYTAPIGYVLGRVEEGMLSWFGPNEAAFPVKIFSVGTTPETTPEPSSLLGCITLGGLMLGSAIRRAKKSS
jgi:hypothetical protein